MDQSFDLEKALRILKTKKITKGEVARKLGYEQTYLSKMISGERPISDQFLHAFIQEYGAYLQDIELVVEDPIKEILFAVMRLEAKADIQSVIISKLFEVLNPAQKEGLKDLLDGDLEGKEGFELINEAAKMRAEARVKRK